jgi:hypothetical protein
MAGGRCRARGSMDFGRMSLGLVLGRADGPSYLAASLSMVVELHEGRIDAAAANGVDWGSRSALVATVSHF